MDLDEAFIGSGWWYGRSTGKTGSRGAEERDGEQSKIFGKVLFFPMKVRYVSVRISEFIFGGKRMKGGDQT